MPLTGVRVVDLTRIISGPFCSMLLADLGADVVKIEPPGDGDPLREQGVKVDGMSWYYASYNRNKRSLSVDLRSDEGKEILARLIERSDVLVENYRPGVLAKMGFPPERLEKLNPRLVVGSVSGFGADGPYAQRPAFDFIAQAMSGYMSVNGEEGSEPQRTGIPISDLVAGLYGALGIVAALHGRGNSGKGQRVGISLLDGLVSFLSFMASNYLATGRIPLRTGNDHPLVAPYGLYAASDGPIAIAPSHVGIYDRLLKALDLERLRDDPRFLTNALRMQNRAALRQEVETVTRHQNQAHWIAHLNAAGVPCGPVLDLAQVFRDPQVLHQQMVIDVPHPGRGTVRMHGFPLKFSDTPCRLRMPAPELGAETDSVLAELGYRDAAIRDLRTRRIV
ncbi:MAG: CoA transferase [Alphaproteobacteria bacterium]|nr:CoA transferase [Alphaproteobacteria bacterium]